MGQTIACANQKGGVGKTTTVVNLGAYLALAGDRVLVVDLDPQGNATSGLGIDRARLDRSVYEAVIDDVPLAELVHGTAIPGLQVVPSTIALAGAEVELVPMEQREQRLGRLIEAIRDRYDYVLIDCPPSLGLLTVSALTAADAVLIPLQCEYYALEGLTQLIATVNLVRDHLNPALAVKGVVLTMFDARTNLSAQVGAEARLHLGAAVFDAVIPRSVRLSEAPSHGRPIALYRPESRGARAYQALADEFRARERSLATGGPTVTTATTSEPAALGSTPPMLSAEPGAGGRAGSAVTATPAAIAAGGEAVRSDVGSVEHDTIPAAAIAAASYAVGER